nr:MAG TPA: hypothetical protein [Bacteriophage sp.]
MYDMFSYTLFYYIYKTLHLWYDWHVDIFYL